MKKMLFFYQESCPYCRSALRDMKALMAENPSYAAIEIEMVDELREPERADRYDYWYVPTIYVDGEKLHEGALSREKLEAVLRRAACMEHG